MAESKNDLFSLYKKALYWATLGMGLFYMMWSLMQFIVWKKPYVKLMKWCWIALALGVVLYVVIAKLRYPEEMEKIKEFLRRERSREQIFLIGFFLWYIVCVAARTMIDGKDRFGPNDNRMFYTALSVMLMFPLTEIMGRERIKKFMNVALNIALVTYTAVCAWVLVNYLQGILVSFPSGNAVEVYKNQSLTIGIHRNTTAAYSMIILGICVYMLMTLRSKLRFLVYIPAMLVHFLVIVLTNSRTCFVVVFCMAALAAIARGLKYIKIKNKVLVFALVAVVLVVGVAAFSLLRNEIIANSAEVWREKLQKPGIMNTRKIFGGFNGRVNIWIASVKLMFSSPDRFLFGVTPTMLPSVLQGIGQFPVNQPHCHNMILQVGACFGVPMMILYTWFCVSIIRRSYRVMKYEGDKLFKGAWTVPLILFGILLNETMEVLTMANKFFNQTMFFLLAGWIVVMDKILAEKTGLKATE